MFGVIRDVRIESLCATVSKNRIPVETRLGGVVNERRIKRLKAGTGVEKLSIVSADIYASDMCVYSAKKLFAEGLVNKSDIGAVVFVTQNPDYPVPATAFSIQAQLGLDHDVLAFDVNSSCPGFVYGVYIAASMMSNLDKKVLLCCGDVVTHEGNYNPNDTAFLSIMGDGAAVAVLGKVDKRQERSIIYNIESYGEQMKVLYVPRGRARDDRRTMPDGTVIVEPENYAIMDGMAVLNFTLEEVPSNIMRLLSYAKLDKSEIERAFVHQANEIVVQSLANKLEIPNDIMPFRCKEIGNTDMATIPVCMAECKKNGDFGVYHRTLLSGFGAGLSVASMILDTSDLQILPTCEI